MGFSKIKEISNILLQSLTNNIDQLNNMRIQYDYLNRQEKEVIE